MTIKMTPGYTKLPIKGRAKFINKLRDNGELKRHAMKVASSKFNVSAKAFNAIWN